MKVAKWRVGTRLVSVVLALQLCLWLVPSTAWAEVARDASNEGTAEAVVNQQPSQPLEGDDGGLENTPEITKPDQGNDSGHEAPADGVIGDEAADGDPAGELTSDKKAEEETPPEQDAVEKSEPLSVSYAAHVSYVGWQEEVKDGALAGTTGKSLAVEALRLSLSEKDQGSLVYSVFVQNEGWTSEAADGDVVGTTGQTRPIEAIKIRLDGDAAQKYDVYYRVYVAHLGWLDWSSNDDKAGSFGYGFAVEGSEVQLIEKGAKAPGATASPYRELGNVAYRTHVSYVGWMDAVADGTSAGTTGRALALEALSISLPDQGLTGDIVYSTHLSDVGWQSERKNGAAAGTTGQNRQMEAVKIQLTGDIATLFDVYYQVHVQGYGWLNWTSNGSIAGTTGLGFRVEAIRVQLVEKGSIAPSGSGPSYVPAASVAYTAHAEALGWMDQVWSDAVAGTTGQALSLQALKMNLSSQIPGGIQYSLHVQGIGWQNPVADGAVAGTTGKALRAEAVTIALTGEAAQYYDVYYRAHCEAYGWLGWAKNGEYAGTTSCSYRMEALQVVIVGKGAAAPGSTSGAYKNTPAIPASYQAMNARVNGLSSPSGWLLAIDSVNCLVGVYQGSRGNWNNLAMWSCAPGQPWTPTVTGIYSVGLKGYSFGSGYTCYYWTQFYGDYLFHSVLYYQGSNVIMDGTLGRPASHGCVRLPIDQAKWIYDNIPYGTTVLSY